MTDIVLSWYDIQIDPLADADYDSTQVIEASRKVPRRPITDMRAAGIRVAARRDDLVLAGGLGAEFLPDMSGRLLIQVLVSGPSSEPAEEGMMCVGLPAEAAPHVLHGAQAAPEIDLLGGGLLRFDRAVSLPGTPIPELFAWMAKAVVRLLTPGAAELSNFELATLLGVEYVEEIDADTVIAQTREEEALASREPIVEFPVDDQIAEEVIEYPTLFDLLQRSGDEFIETEASQAEAAPLESEHPLPGTKPLGMAAGALEREPLMQDTAVEPATADITAAKPASSIVEAPVEEMAEIVVSAPEVGPIENGTMESEATALPAGPVAEALPGQPLPVPEVEAVAGPEEAERWTTPSFEQVAEATIEPGMSAPEAEGAVASEGAMGETQPTAGEQVGLAAEEPTPPAEIVAEPYPAADEATMPPAEPRTAAPEARPLEPRIVSALFRSRETAAKQKQTQPGSDITPPESPEDEELLIRVRWPNGMSAPAEHGPERSTARLAPADKLLLTGAEEPLVHVRWTDDEATRGTREQSPRTGHVAHEVKPTPWYEEPARLAPVPEPASAPRSGPAPKAAPVKAIEEYDRTAESEPALAQPPVIEAPTPETRAADVEAPARSVTSPTEGIASPLDSHIEALVQVIPFTSDQAIADSEEAWLGGADLPPVIEVADEEEVLAPEVEALSQEDQAADEWLFASAELPPVIEMADDGEPELPAETDSTFPSPAATLPQEAAPDAMPPLTVQADTQVQGPTLKTPALAPPYVEVEETSAPEAAVLLEEQAVAPIETPPRPVSPLEQMGTALPEVVSAHADTNVIAPARHIDARPLSEDEIGSLMEAVRPSRTRDTNRLPVMQRGAASDYVPMDVKPLSQEELADLLHTVRGKHGDTGPAPTAARAVPAEPPVDRRLAPPISLPVDETPPRRAMPDASAFVYPPPSRSKGRGFSKLTMHLCAACNRYAAREIAPYIFKCYRCKAVIEYRPAPSRR